jgi:phage shock protein A
VFKKWWNYIKAWFGKKSDEAMDPEIEIEMAIKDAQKKDQQLRNQAAQVIAHRTQVASELEDAAGDVAEAKELAKQALLKADGAAKAGNASEAERWNQAASSLAMKLQASQSNMDMLQKQLEMANQQADTAKKAVQTNAANVQELAAQRMKLLGELQAAKMQEKVNDAMSSMTATAGIEAPSLDEVENKIQARMAQASAKAELGAATPEGAMAELKESSMQMEADAMLDSLRAELGLGSSGELSTPAPAAPPSSETPAPPA